MVAVVPRTGHGCPSSELCQLVILLIEHDNTIRQLRAVTFEMTLCPWTVPCLSVTLRSDCIFEMSICGHLSPPEPIAGDHRVNTEVLSDTKIFEASC